MLRTSLLVLATILTVPASAHMVTGESSRTVAKAVATVQYRLNADFQSTSTVIQFGSLDYERVNRLYADSKSEASIIDGVVAMATPVSVDINVYNESLPTSDKRLHWIPVTGGSVARFTIDTVDARGIRMGIVASEIPEGAELRFSTDYGSPILVNYQQIQSLRTSDNTYWGPLSYGQDQSVEFFVPSGKRLPEIAPVKTISHFFDYTNSNVTDPALRSALECMVGVSCKRNQLGNEFNLIENSAAKMLFQRNGGGFLCSGTLINDSDSSTQIPYFITAEHCIRSEDSAKSLITFWEAESRTCSSSGYLNDFYVGGIPLYGGATLVNSHAPHDIALLRLLTPPPSFAYFAGWVSEVWEMQPTETSRRFQPFAVHHPAGSNKSYTLTSYLKSTSNGDMSKTGSHIVNALEGSFTGGSSGGALFRNINGNPYLMATLVGTIGGGCSNVGEPYPDFEYPPGNAFVFSRFDYWYNVFGKNFLGPNIRNLSGSNTGLASWDYSGTWFDPERSGWGMMLQQFPDQVFALFFVYDPVNGAPEWYQIQSQWTEKNVIRATPLLRQGNQSPWGSSQFNPNLRVTTTVGSLNLTFRDRDVLLIEGNIRGRPVSAVLRKLE